jgi:hypothetical protein
MNKNIENVTRNLTEALSSIIDRHNEGLICDKEFTSGVLRIAQSNFDETTNLRCHRYSIGNFRFADCHKLGCKTPHFELRFDNGETQDLFIVNEEEISRTLSHAMLLKENDASMVDLLLLIQSTRFYKSPSINTTANTVIKNLLKMFVISDRRSVAYCFDCEKYVVGHPTDNVCAYDELNHPNQPDGHRIFRMSYVD